MQNAWIESRGSKDHRIAAPLLERKEDLARNHGVGRNQRIDGQGLWKSRNGVASRVI